MYPEASSKVCHDSFCQLGNSVSCNCNLFYIKHRPEDDLNVSQNMLPYTVKELILIKICVDGRYPTNLETLLFHLAFQEMI
jgi:hypothetical protein